MKVKADTVTVLCLNELEALQIQEPIMKFHYLPGSEQNSSIYITPIRAYSLNMFYPAPSTYKSCYLWNCRFPNVRIAIYSTFKQRKIYYYYIILVCILVGSSNICDFHNLKNFPTPAIDIYVCECDRHNKSMSYKVIPFLSSKSAEKWRCFIYCYN